MCQMRTQGPETNLVLKIFFFSGDSVKFQLRTVEDTQKENHNLAIVVLHL